MNLFARAITSAIFSTALLVGLLISPTSFAQVEEPNHLTLEQSIEIGLKNSVLVQKNENNVSLNGEQLLQGYAQFLPNLGVRASYAYTDGTNLYTFSGSNLVDQRSFSPSYTVGTSLNLFNGLSDYAGLKLALTKRDASRFSLNWARQQVILDITQTYLQVILDGKLLDIAVKNLAASNERLKLLRGETEVGSASLADLYRQQAQTSSDELLLSNTQSRLNDDTTILVRKLRVDPRKKYEFEVPQLTPEASALSAKPVDELIKLALDQRSDLKAQTQNVKSTDWGITQAKSGYLPKLDLAFTFGGAGSYLTRQIVNGADTLPPNQRGLLTQLGDQFAYTVSLNFTWSIFDRFLTRYNVASARTTWENAQIDQKDVELQTVADVRIANDDYQIAQQQVKSAETGLKAAVEAYQAIKGRFSVGAASFLDLLTSQTALVQAQSNEAQAVINLKLREKALAYATGTLAP